MTGLFLRASVAEKSRKIPIELERKVEFSPRSLQGVCLPRVAPLFNGRRNTHLLFGIAYWYVEVLLLAPDPFDS